MPLKQAKHATGIEDLIRNKKLLRTAYLDESKTQKRSMIN